MNIFEEIKNVITAEDAARRYGLTFDRAGKRAICIFHNDHHPSVSFKGKIFRCWSCGAHGSCLDLTMQLFGLDLVGAAKRLNDDFSLGLNLDRHKPTPEIRNHQRIKETWTAYCEWRETTLLTLTEAFRVGHLAKLHKNINEWTQEEVAAIKWHETIGHWLQTLENGSWLEQKAIFIDRKGVESVCRMILQTTPNLSAAS